MWLWRAPGLRQPFSLARQDRQQSPTTDGTIESNERRPADRRSVGQFQPSAGLTARSRTENPTGVVLVNTMASPDAPSNSKPSAPRPAPRWASRGAQHPAQPVRRLALQLQPIELMLIAGLAGLFVVNAIVAIVEPTDVTVGRAEPRRTSDPGDERSVGRMGRRRQRLDNRRGAAGGDVDPRARPFVLAWAGAWLFAVALIKLTSLKALGG